MDDKEKELYDAVYDATQKVKHMGMRNTPSDPDEAREAHCGYMDAKQELYNANVAMDEYRAKVRAEKNDKYSRPERRMIWPVTTNALGKEVKPKKVEEVIPASEILPLLESIYKETGDFNTIGIMTSRDLKDMIGRIKAAILL